MRAQLLVFIWIVAGCGGAASDRNQGSTCDPAGTFDPPVAFTALDLSALQRPPIGTSVGLPWFTADELTVYFSYEEQDPATQLYGTRLYRERRSMISQPFSAPVAIAGVDLLLDPNRPSVTSDGLTLFFEISGSANHGASHLYMATRTSGDAAFGGDTFLADVNSTAGPTDEDLNPFVTADGQELWFDSIRAARTGDHLYRALWNGSGFANVTGVTALDSDGDDFLPVLSADRLTIYFASFRPIGALHSHIWTAHRDTTDEDFPAPSMVAELSSTGDQAPGWLSPDNCRLYFGADLGSGAPFNLYVAIRHPM